MERMAWVAGLAVPALLTSCDGNVGSELAKSKSELASRDSELQSLAARLEDESSAASVAQTALASREVEITQLKEALAHAKRVLMETTSSSAKEIQELRADGDQLRDRIRALDEAMLAQARADDERRRAGMTSPAYLKTIHYQQEGDGFQFYFEAADSDGRAVRPDGKLTLTIGVKVRGTDRLQDRFLQKDFDVATAVYKNVTLGVGDFKRETTVFVLPRIPWADIRGQDGLGLNYPDCIRMYLRPDLLEHMQVFYEMKLRPAADDSKVLSLAEDFR